MPNDVIEDPVYGPYTITEPLLRDLLASPTVQRLGQVHQAGASYLVRPGRDLPRLAHAVGVMLLVRRLGGSLHEQAAGLIHDVSHTAFSHTVDQVFGDRDETYHEQYFAQWVRDSDIQQILDRHAVDAEELLDSERWSLLEQPAPDLCADRVDYTLRDLLHIGWLTASEIGRFLDSLTVHHGQMVTRDLTAAVWFARQYHREVTGLFMDPREAYANARLAQAIRLALDGDVIAPSDLLGTDNELLGRLRDAQRADVTRILDELTPQLTVLEDPVTFDVRGFSKARVVDPLVLVAPDRTVRASTLEPSLRDLHDEVHRKARDGIPVRAVAQPLAGVHQP